jgi:hypothetical protein
VWAAVVGLSVGVAEAKEPDPVATVRLEPLGFQSLQQEFLVAGSSMLTVDFVDKDHLLVTFTLRRLMKRLADPPPGDDDRMIGAYLVELPTGKVLARTEWRVHDRAQYLWNLGHGRFLLRVRDELSVIAPMRGATMEGAFEEHPFLQMGRRIEAVLVSADGDLLTVETTKPGVVWDPEDKNTGPVQIGFYRLKGGDGPGLMATSAGTIQTGMAVALPMTTAGLVDVQEGGRDQWLFNFDVHAGGVRELAEFDTSCVPHATFVGRGEFVAFGCRGSADKQDIAGFNLKGDAMWQQSFFDTHVFPTFAFAPEAGRFALGRTIVDGAVTAENLLSAVEVNAQEVRVYQSYSGQLLLRTACTPAERAGQNFAISPDGLELAVVQETMVRHAATKDDAAYTDKETAVEVYALPALTEKDRAAVKAAEAMAPEDTGARIDEALARLSGGSGSGAGAGDAAGAVAPVANVPAVAAPAAVNVPAAAAAAPSAGDAGEAGSGGGAAGDAVPDAPRKAPTLYGPGEGPK